MHYNLSQYLATNEFYREALQIVKKNSEGKIYLVGGGVFRPIIQGNMDFAKDIDFLVYELASNILLPDNRKLTKNVFGHPRFVKGNQRIDPIQLTKYLPIVRHNLSPTLENYLQNVPLNVQSIAYDISENKIMGSVGLKAIENRIVKLNNRENARYSCRNFHNYSVNEKIVKVANSLGFNYELDIETI